MTLNTSATGVSLIKPRIVLSGKVSGAPDGSRPRLVLKATSRAFGQSYPDRRARADTAGRFRFVARPEINTTYHVALADGESVQGRSRSLDVRVYPTLSINFYSRMPHSVEVLFEVFGPQVNHFAGNNESARPGSAKYAYYYVIPHGSKRAYRLGRGRLHDEGCSITCGRGAWKKVRLTRRVRRSRGILGCIRGTGFLGMGSTYPACGRRVIRLG